MNRKILRVQPLYNIIISFIFIVVLILFLFVPTWLSWKGDSASKGVYYFLFSIGALYFIYLFLNSLQFAVVTEQGIKLYRIFFLIADIKWNEIKSVREEEINDDHRCYFPFYWLVIRTEKRQEVEKGGKNHKEPPWQIIANKRNKEIISQYKEITKKLLP